MRAFKCARTGLFCHFGDFEKNKIDGIKRSTRNTGDKIFSLAGTGTPILSLLAET